MFSMKLSNDKLDNFLRPRDVIHKLKLQVAFVIKQKNLAYQRVWPSIKGTQSFIWDSKEF